MDLNKIGTFLKKLRKERGYTQQEVADELFVSSKSVSRWENGDGIPDIDTLAEIARFYGITVDELINGEKSKETKISDNRNTSKRYREKMISKMSVYLTVSLSITAGLFLVGLVLGLLFIFIIFPILLTLGIIIGLIIYIYGLKENRRKVYDDDEIMDDDVRYYEQAINPKNKLFMTIMVCFISILISLIFLLFGAANFAIIGVGSLLILYFIVNVGYKNKATPNKINKRILIMLGLTSVLFIISSFTVSYNLSYGSITEICKGQLLIVYLFELIEYGNKVYKIICIGLIIISMISIMIVMCLRIKYKIFIILGLVIAGFMGNILTIIELNSQIVYYLDQYRQLVLIHTVFTVPGMYVLANFIIYLILYIVNYYREKRTII